MKKSDKIVNTIRGLMEELTPKEKVQTALDISIFLLGYTDKIVQEIEEERG